MADEQDPTVLARHIEAMAQLSRIPGVMRVAFGLKETGGQIVQQWAYRVYVERKKPLAELRPEEIIPSEIDGVKTDVLWAREVRPATTTPSMNPGDAITRWVPNDFQSSGTLGLIVRKGTDRFVLTNQHVLSDDTHIGDTSSQEVFDPHRKTCAEIQCNNPIAHVIDNQGVKANHPLGGKTFYVDAALASVIAGVGGSNTVSGIGALDQGLLDLSTVPLTGNAPSSPISVQKRGAVTGLTQGQVIEMNHLDSGTVIWEMHVRATTGFSYQKTWELAPDENADQLVAQFTGTVHATKGTASSGNATVNLSGTVMVRPGDSGSIVVDNQRHIVGLLYAETVVRAHVIVDGQPSYELLSLGDAVVCYIFPVFDAMGLDTAAGVVPPGSSSAGPVRAMPQEPALQGVWGPPQQAAMRDLEAAIARTDAGRRVLSLVSCHYSQIAHLVHHRRRVMVAWHRNRGPGFAAAFLRAIADPAGKLPVEIGGIRLVDGMARFRNALLMEGDNSLREDVRAYGDMILRLAESASTIPELVRTFSEVE